LGSSNKGREERFDLRQTGRSNPGKLSGAILEPSTEIFPLTVFPQSLFFLVAPEPQKMEVAEVILQFPIGK
jgi:hypothetical protein